MVEFGPAARIKRGIAECIEEVCAAFSVWVGDLHFGWEEGGEVAMELWGFEDFKSQIRGAELYEGGGDSFPGGKG